MKEDLKISGFKTPDFYFENFEAHLFTRIDEENLPKVNGLKVPDGYFEDLEDIILAKEFISNKPSRVISLYPKKYLVYASAIAAILIIGVFLLNFNKIQSNTDTIELGVIDKYIDEGNLNIDLYDLTTYFENNEISLEDFETEPLSQTTLKNYLLDNLGDEWLLQD